jgi:hypothetical protein
MVDYAHRQAGMSAGDRPGQRYGANQCPNLSLTPFPKHVRPRGSAGPFFMS